jgi:hypothetical protein
MARDTDRWRPLRSPTRLLPFIAAGLAQTAARIVREAGADQDLKARERLVAATRYQNLRDTGELFLGNPNTLVRDPGDLIAELDRIDRNEHDDK